MAKTAILFPGQGAQQVGMMADFAESSDAARSVFERANELLGFDLAEICFCGPADRLDATDVAQPALFVASVAAWRALQESSLAAEVVPAAAAGLSLGEYTALWLAGSLSFEDALRVVRARGQFMQQAARKAPGGMVSVIGLNEGQVRDLCGRACQAQEVLSPANFNCPGQIVVSGSAAACERVVPLVERAGGRAVPLRVAGAFHSELMRSAADALAEVLAEVAIRTPRFPVPSNVTGDYHDADPQRIRQLLVEQVTQPVRWEANIRRLMADGLEQFVEVGPGRVLTGLLRKINRQAKGTSISESSALAVIRDG